MATNTSPLEAPSSSTAPFYPRIAIAVTATISAIALIQPGLLPVNSVILAIGLMIAMCLLRMPVAIALIASAMVGAINSGMTTNEAIGAINDNLAGGAQVGMTYVMIGAFAVALGRSGLLDVFANKTLGAVSGGTSHKTIKWMLFSLFIAASIMSQNIVPVHIAFIPVMIPPLLAIFNKLCIDRRAVACIIACSISVSYLLLPTGFGAIYLFEILLPNVNSAGEAYELNVTASQIPSAMFLPVMGIVAGMLVAVFITYRKPRDYDNNITNKLVFHTEQPKLKVGQLVFVLGAIVVALLCQILFDSLLIGAMVGFMVLTVSGVFKWQQQDDVFTEGMRMMVQIAVIITIASGFAGVLEATGEIPSLVQSTGELIGNNKAIAALLMLLVGLFITIGFGDSFASVPILAPIYVPLALSLGFSPAATIALLGASAALGDAGSPASTISLGVTSGLNADGQHDHIKDSVIPTFTHANFGMVLFAWIAALVL
ncbi:Na+/H+ antiporter family protein [Photobacterium rosenbergii]|uniref:Na+/H+ antiporter family protein n=1 Tax=Photobacterium rosenbergii TaxID=294936 RepID=UPI001C992B3D|nr:Na+/H+ antiporter NhaC family protein [Photobacterium rosenbergii]MBY5947432.1 sodium:proton antiporter [Photobacterium rosenbergii]